jgi:hypothetical protein
MIQSAGIPLSRSCSKNDHPNPFELMSPDSDILSSLPLSAVLRDPLLLLHFRRFAESLFDAEPLHFLLDCQTFFKQLQTQTLNLSQLLESLDYITDEYVKAGARQQVNLSSHLRDITLASVQTMRFTEVAMTRDRFKPVSSEMKAQSRFCLHGAVLESVSAGTVEQLSEISAIHQIDESSSEARQLVRWIL